MKRSLVRLGLVGFVLCGCGRTTNAPEQVDALVAFDRAVDTLLLGGAGVVTSEILWSLSAARVRGSPESLDRLDGQPQVKLVERLSGPEHPIRVYVQFRDRLSGADTLTAADRAAVASLGGQVRYVYTSSLYVAAIVPVSALLGLQTCPLVAAVTIVGRAAQVP